MPNSISATSLFPSLHILAANMAVTAPSDAPKVITLTNEERDSGVMSDKKLYDAIDAFYTDGLVVVENAIDVALIDKLNKRMLEDTDKLLSGKGQVHFK